MKSIYITLFFILLIKITNGQEFVFPLYFEDSAGHKDTLILGYDLSATDSIDNIFGEINILAQPLDSHFDVRISDIFYNPTATYNTKKQIIKNSCNFTYTHRPIITIEIKSNHWPVTASWDSSLFNNTCRIKSGFSSIPFDPLWDVYRPNDFEVLLNQQQQIEFYSIYQVGNYNMTSYLNSNNDTINEYFIWLDDVLPVNISKIENPSNNYELRIQDNYLFVKTELSNYKIKEIDIIDLTGKTIIKRQCDNINISCLSKGLYFCKIKEHDNIISTMKFIKR